MCATSDDGVAARVRRAVAALYRDVTNRFEGNIRVETAPYSDAQRQAIRTGAPGIVAGWLALYVGGQSVTVSCAVAATVIVVAELAQHVRA